MNYKVSRGNPEQLSTFSKLSDQDLPLIQRLEQDTLFNQATNRVDIFFYSLDGRLLRSKVDSRNFSVVEGGSRGDGDIVDITLNPEKDVIENGFKNGDVHVLYNFVDNLYAPGNTRPAFFIESISPDRTEIRALSNDLSSEDISNFTLFIKQDLENKPFFEDFRLNFENNVLPIAINIDTLVYRENQAIVIKLYEPLPSNIRVKDSFLVEKLVGDSVLYEVITEVQREEEETRFSLRGPNFDIDLVEENNNPTGFLDYNDLFSYPVTNSFYEVYSLFNEQGSQISIDHTDYSEFIHFSSAEERVRNFYYKAKLLEDYRNQISVRASNTASLDSKIRGIVNNFDHYERYLYYETGSFTWPKSSTSRPYSLYSTGSTQVINWYSGLISSASYHDSVNLDRLINSIPSFIREDENNTPYLLFVDMIGQHFDNLWIYSKAVTDRYDADNRLDFGISKDLVRDAIQSFGIKLYNNNESLDNLFAAFTGDTYDSGSEQITTLITAVEGSGSLSGSTGNRHLQPVSKDNYRKEIYKRLYHNIPLLLKSKGTERGIRALINTFGIPSDILTIKTYGGADTSTTPFYGPSVEFTGSLSKIRIYNTDTVVTGSTLSRHTSVVNPGRDYSTDLHTVEIGFSPTDSLNNYIISHPSMSSFDLDEYIGDPRLAYSSSYKSLDDLAELVFTSNDTFLEPYDVFDFVRLIKFFDNSIFRVLKEFLPARSNIDTGIIIKPHLLDRSKVKQPELKWSNQTSRYFTHSNTALDFTGSYYSTNFSIDGAINVVTITGSKGLDTVLTSSYTEIYTLPSGGYSTLIRNNHDEPFYTGEFSGSILNVSTGELNQTNVFKKLNPKIFSFKYLPSADYSDLYQFLSQTTNTSPSSTLVISENPTTGLYASSYVLFNTSYFSLNGSEASPGIPESSSVDYTFSGILEPGETVQFNGTVIWSDLTGENLAIPPYGSFGKVELELYSGSTLVDTDTVYRTAFNQVGTVFQEVSFSNNTVLDIDIADLSVYVRFRSFYTRITGITGPATDARVSLTGKLYEFTGDYVGLLVSQSIVNNYTSSFIQDMTFPRESSLNGDITSFFESAEEVVFEYVKPSLLSSYDYNNLNYGIEGGNYKALVSTGEDFINLTHQTSAPYTGSFSASLDNLAVDALLQFDFFVDFDSYYLQYGATSNSETPSITASIRDASTKTVLDNLSFKVQQGQYPRTVKSSLSYLNDTASPISNLEFYYEVNIPKSTTSGHPIVNLNNLRVNSFDPNQSGYYSSKIETKKLLPNTYYIRLDRPIEILSGSIELDTTSSQFYNVSLIPGVSEKFKFNSYAATSNNVSDLRRSNFRIKIDDATYTPTQGSYTNFFVPANYELISSSIANGVETVPERSFAEIQDSNYSSVGWKRARYDGVEENNRTANVPVLGNEPFKFLETFEGRIFPSSSTAVSIRELFSGSSADVQTSDISFTTLSKPFYSSGSSLLDSELVPWGVKSKDLVTSGSNAITFISLKNGKEQQKVVDSKVYKVDSDQIFYTNERGIIINEE